MLKNTILLLLVLTGSLFAQFAEVYVEVGTDRLKVSERQEVEGIEDVIRQFYLTSSWADDVVDLDMIMDINFMFQATINISGVKYYQVQAVIHNRLDQQYFAKNIKFPYSRGQSVRLSPTFEPLASTLTFYAYIMIASELDTYDLMGGSPYYAKATSLASLGQNARHVSGEWTERLKLVEKYSQNKELRRIKAHFYQALDAVAAEEPNPEMMVEALLRLHAALEAIYMREGPERYTSIFLRGHAIEITEMMRAAGLTKQLKDMTEFDPNNKRQYEKGLK